MRYISVIFLTASMAIAQTPGQEENCDDLREGSDDRIRCINREVMSGAAARQNQRGQPRTSSNVTRCESLLRQSAAAVSTPAYTTSRTQWLEIGTTNPNPVTPITGSVEQEAIRCRSLQRATILSNGGSFGATDTATSQDGKITCVKLAGYTADWESCRSTLSMYNNLVVMEAGLLIVQSVQATQTQNSIQQQTMQRVNQRDGQNAAYDAQIAQTQQASQLNQQKAAAYAAAVVALGSKIAGWIKDDLPGLQGALCRERAAVRTLGSERVVSDQPTLPGQIEFAKPSAVPAPSDCRESVAKAYEAGGSEMIANKQAKAAFTTAAMMFAAKGIQAGIAANRLGNIAKQVEEAKKSTEDPYNPSQFEYCTVSPNDPRCAGQSTRTPGSGITDGGFSFGDSFGNNAVGNLGEEEKLGNDPLDPLNPGDSVADVNNPFTDDAKKASGILDPAGAASIQPGAAGGAGGGGGAPGLGGGSASLGNDVPGVDESKKESDIKANKADGKYSDATGAGGFQAIKPLKEDNPFANLFGGQGGGKLEEDRSIASGDIDGQDSGLFSKISKRYGQVQADKRIEAKNLEE